MTQQQREVSLAEEPIFWTSTIPGFSEQDRRRVRMINGRMVEEKHPQIGHTGDIRDRKRMAIARFVYMINHYGNEIAMVLTTAAAHADANSSFAQYQWRKARAHGWYHTGDCPCALLKTGRLSDDHIPPELVREFNSTEPCKPGEFKRDHPCPHSIKLQKARQRMHAEAEAIRLEPFKTDGKRLIEAQNAQTEALVSMMREAIAANGARSNDEIREIMKSVIAEQRAAAKGNKEGH